MDFNSQKIGNFIRQERLKKHLKQNQLAELLHVSPAAVSKWEAGVNVPDLANLKEISKILDVTISEILEGELAPDDSIKFAESSSAIAVSDTKKKSNINRKIITISTVTFLFLCCIIVFIIVHNYHAQPIFETVDEFYGHIEGMPFERIHCVVFESTEGLSVDDYDAHYETLINNYDISSFEDCDAIVFMYFTNYNGEVSVTTAKYFAVLLPTFYEFPVD